MPIVSLIPSFNGGELSPLIHLRSDIEKYRSGCRTLENFLIIPYGGVKRRAGFAYVETAHTKCRVFRFQVSSDIGFVLEFGGEYIRFYKESSPVQSGGDDYEIATPYQVEDLAEIQSVQINNIAYFTHPRYPVHKLSRFKDDSWSFVPVDFAYPGMMDENLRRGSRLITDSAGEVGDTVKVESSVVLFKEGHLGSFYQISHPRRAGQFAVKLSATGASPGDVSFSNDLLVQGAWTFTTSGNWKGEFNIQRSDDAGLTYQTIRTFRADEDANYSAGGEEPELVRMRIRWEHGGDGENNPSGKLEASGAYLRGLIKITEVVNEKRVKGIVIQPVQEGPTSYWREGAWSDVRGFPRTVCAHEQRIVFGGTNYQPQTVWASVVDDYENFEPGGVNDDDSWTHVFASDQQNFINWMISQKSLLIGTSGDEWVMASSDQESIITPTNVRARRHSGNGSAFLKARLIDSSVIFIQRGGKRARDMTYSFQNDGYETSDLTLLAEHIAGQGIIETAYQSSPESRLWCVTASGELIVLTYDRGQSLSGWQRITTGGESGGFESVAIKSTSGEMDQVWVSVRRNINGTLRRYVERMNDDGSFVETPWSELYADPAGLPLWDAGYSDYALSDVVFHPLSATGALFLCKLAYNTSTDEDPPFINSTNWETAFDWDVETTELYFVGNQMYRSGVWYSCIQDAARSIPVQWPGDDGGLYWAAVTTFEDPPEFKAANEYEADDLVSSGGKTYKCLIDHSAWGIDTSNATYWQVQQGSYEAGDLVSVGSINYRCTTDHTPSLVSKPGIGADWEDYWEIYLKSPNRFYVDSGVLKNNAGTLTELTGLGHLEGETVQILANGYTIPSRVVTGGKISFNQPNDPTSFQSLAVGLQYDSVLEPMALEAGMDNGTSVSREKRIHELVIYFHESGGCKVSAKPSGPFDTLPFRMGDSFGNQAQPLFTGPFVHMLDARHDLEASFVLKQDLPMPMTILAVVPKWNIYGDQI